jgi:hypothetical protein
MIHAFSSALQQGLVNLQKTYISGYSGILFLNGKTLSLGQSQEMNRVNTIQSLAGTARWRIGRVT